MDAGEVEPAQDHSGGAGRGAGVLAGVGADRRDGGVTTLQRRPQRLGVGDVGRDDVQGRVADRQAGAIAHDRSHVVTLVEGAANEEPSGSTGCPEHGELHRDLLSWGESVSERSLTVSVR